MKELHEIQKTVQKNCDLIDAESGQNYGLCIYLLKMRDYYRWHNRIPLHDDIENESVHKWIAEIEEYWESISGQPLQDLELNGHRYTPFESVSINEHLVPEKFIYSGGLGYGGIPLFFLAELDAIEDRSGFTIYLAGKELSRGLFGSPALFIGDTIFIRKETLSYWLWSRYDEWGFDRRDNTLGRAMSYYPFESDPQRAISEITAVELETLIQHEIGEGLLEKELGTVWNDMVVTFAYTKTEILLRAVRDLIVDCTTTLPFLIGEERIPSIHFYFSGFSDMRKELFPSLMKAYREWCSTSDSDRLLEVAESKTSFWIGIGKKATDLYNSKQRAAQTEIDSLIESSIV